MRRSKSQWLLCPHVLHIFAQSCTFQPAISPNNMQPLVNVVHFTFCVKNHLRFFRVSYIWGKFISKLLSFNPILRRGGGHICPPYHISAFFSGRTYPRRLQVYSKFKFCNYQTHKMGPGSKNFSYGAWEPAKVGWVVDFLLRFCLKIGCIFYFPWNEMIFSRWNRTLMTPSAKAKN